MIMFNPYYGYFFKKLKIGSNKDTETMYASLKTRPEKGLQSSPKPALLAGASSRACRAHSRAEVTAAKKAPRLGDQFFGRLGFRV